MSVVELDQRRILYFARNVPTLGVMWTSEKTHEIIFNGKLISINDDSVKNMDHLFTYSLSVSMVDDYHKNYIQEYDEKIINFDIDNLILKYQKFLDKVNLIKTQIFNNVDDRVKVKISEMHLRYGIIQKLIIFHFDNFNYQICDISGFTYKDANVHLLLDKPFDSENREIYANIPRVVEDYQSNEIEVNRSTYLEMSSLYPELIEIKQLFKSLIIELNISDQ